MNLPTLTNQPNNPNLAMNYPDDDIESGLNACLARNQTTALPSGRPNAGLERGPVLCTTHLEFGDLVSVHAMFLVFQ